MSDMLTNNVRGNLKNFIIERALKYGDFTLASGAKSRYYLDIKQVLLYPSSLDCVSFLINKMLREVEFEAIGGPELGALPMAVAVGMRRYVNREGEGWGSSKEIFVVRKEPKKHGTGQMVEGRVKQGDRVIMLDDVLTTGGSVMNAIREVEVLGADVVKVICVVDRLQGAAEALRGYDYRPIFTIDDFDIKK